MSGIIGVTVGTPTSPAKMKEEIKPVLMVNGAKPDATGNVNVSGGGGGDPLLGSRVKTLEDQVAQLLYTPIAITSFGHTAGIRELGETVTSINFHWTTNKTPKTLTFDGVSFPEDSPGIYLTGKNYTVTTSFNLRVTDETGASDSKTTSIYFYNGVYYGVGNVPHVDSDVIKELSKDLRANKKPSFTVEAGSNQYIYYCLPVRMGTCSFTVGGFTGGFTLVDTIPFTNPSGYEEEYYIYKSDNAGLGETTVYVE